MWVPIPASHREQRIGGLNAASKMRIRSSYATRTLVLGALVGWSFSAGTAFGQKLDPLAGKAGDIKGMLRAGEITDEEHFNEFFEKYLFKQFEAPTRPYSLDTLPTLRLHLKAQYCGIAKADSEVRARLNKMVHAKMWDIVSKGKYGQYDAAIKYNALLVIGDLNDKEGDGKIPAKPYAESLPDLIRVVSPKSRDYMKLAGLIGLERFATAGAIPPAKATELTSTLVEMVNQQTPPANRSPDAHDWIRRLAGQVLASLGNLGPGNSVMKAFESVVSDSDASPTMRCEFAQYLGQLKYAPSAKVDLTALSNALGHMAVDVCKQELESAKLANRAPSRRIVVDSLYSAMVGLVGPVGKSGLVAAAEGSPHKAFVDKLKTGVGSLHKWIDDPKFEDEALAAELGGKISDLETVLVARPTAKLVSDKKEKAAASLDQQGGARAAVDSNSATKQ
jgi:hypothetical protein